VVYLLDLAVKTITVLNSQKRNKKEPTSVILSDLRCAVHKIYQNNILRNYKV
jgi:hypothetical protein